MILTPSGLWERQIILSKSPGVLDVLDVACSWPLRCVVCGSLEFAEHFCHTDGMQYACVNLQLCQLLDDVFGWLRQDRILHLKGFHLDSCGKARDLEPAVLGVVGELSIRKLD